VEHQKHRRTPSKSRPTSSMVATTSIHVPIPLTGCRSSLPLGAPSTRSAPPPPNAHATPETWRLPTLLLGLDGSNKWQTQPTPASRSHLHPLTHPRWLTSERYRPSHKDWRSRKARSRVEDCQDKDPYRRPLRRAVLAVNTTRLQLTVTLSHLHCHPSPSLQRPSPRPALHVPCPHRSS
jgi:hypothetical protein